MKRLLLLFIFIITLGWGGNLYFNEYTGEIKYKKWAIIPALISIAIVMSGLLIATCVICVKSYIVAIIFKFQIFRFKRLPYLINIKSV